MTLHPAIHRELTHILCKHFAAGPEQAAKLATKLIETMGEYDLEIIKGDWVKPETAEGGALTWEAMEQKAAQVAGAFVQDQNRISTASWEALARRALAAEERPTPWNPPELQ
jgi:hypothetical protein